MEIVDKNLCYKIIVGSNLLSDLEIILETQLLPDRVFYHAHNVFACPP